MPDLNRRTFVKGSAAVAGTALAADRFLFGSFNSVAAAQGPEVTSAVEDFVATTCWIGFARRGTRRPT